MHQIGIETIFIVSAVVLFFGLGVAILVVLDHKARIPGGFKRDPFSISGMRRDHPIEAFFTATILLGIIAALALSLLATLGSQFGFFKEKQAPGLLKKLGEERMVERTRHFHNEPVHDFTQKGRKNVCFYCHGDFPHSKEPMVRTLMNMHTQVVGCMTCHSDPRKVKEKTLRFEWLNYSGITVKGPHFGVDVDPATGYLVNTDDFYSKIVAYGEIDGMEQLLELSEDNVDVQEFLKIRDQISDKDREAIKKRFHKYVSPKGRFCSRCHTNEPDAYLPFRKLGFSDRRVSDLTNLNIIGLVQKYREFYMPSLLSSDKNVPDIESLAGQKRRLPVSDKMKKDPRSWWRQQYDTPAEKKNN